MVSVKKTTSICGETFYLVKINGVTVYAEKTRKKAAAFSKKIKSVFKENKKRK